MELPTFGEYISVKYIHETCRLNSYTSFGFPPSLGIYMSVGGPNITVAQLSEAKLSTQKKLIQIKVNSNISSSKKEEIYHR